MDTGEVARILEDKYGIMARFYRIRKDSISDAIAKSVEGALESVVMGAPADIDPYGGGMQFIMKEFRDFINSREAENVGIPGTPTMAAIKGVNHRLKHPYAKRNPRRPSFRDTGLYSTSFRSWVAQ